MAFDDILKKGESFYKGEDGKFNSKALQEDAQDAYKSYNSTQGSFQDKGKAIFGEIKTNHAGGAASDKKEETSEKKE
ncbi:hypothetical protein DICA3_F05050 [Diutina catenulata]